MIRDAKGRKWFMRFKQYRNGWHWDAQCEKGSGMEAGRTFETKLLAEADARRAIQGKDHIAWWQEYRRRLEMRGSECRLTADDWQAIKQAAVL
jgi:hypothetical protein